MVGIANKIAGVAWQGEESMRKRIISAVALTAVAVTGCAPVDRVSGTAEYITEIENQLQVKAGMYGTSVELERGLYECEEKYPIPADHDVDHPSSAPLAECVAKVYEAHAGGAK